MRTWLAIPALAALLLGGCDDDSTGPGQPLVVLTVDAGPIDGTVDHGWLTIDGEAENPYRMVVVGDRLQAGGVDVSSGSHEIAVVAVAANESSLFAGASDASIPVEADSSNVDVLMRQARPDLILSDLSHSPEAPFTGEPITFVAEVTNGGVGFSAPTVLQFRIGSETTGHFYDVPAMQAGEVLHFEREEILQSASTYQVVAFVDPRNDVIELIGTNNAAIELVSVSQPQSPDRR